MKKKKTGKNKITIQDYIKAVKKADRDVELERSVGWTSTTRPHKNKKIYDRKIVKKKFADEY